jgi:purine nucleosidase
MRTLLFIDTDPGVDDAIALLMSLGHPDVEVVAVAGVAGNVGLDLVMRNLPAVLDAAGAPDIPIHAGCDRALLGDQRDAAGFHGSNGLGGIEVPRSARRIADGHASVTLARMARERPGELTLLALGPLTNVAVALALEPALPRLLRRTVVMGGTIRGQGNVTAAAEFNAWADPEAARRVFAAGLRPELVSWETTVEHAVPWETWDAWTAGDTPRARFSRAMTREMIARERARGAPGFLIPDPLAAAVAIEPGAVLAADERPVSVELCGRETRGQTVVDERRNPPREAMTTAAAVATIVRRIDMATVGRVLTRALAT